MKDERMRRRPRRIFRLDPPGRIYRIPRESLEMFARVALVVLQADSGFVAAPDDVKLQMVDGHDVVVLAQAGFDGGLAVERERNTGRRMQPHFSRAQRD